MKEVTLSPESSRKIGFTSDTHFGHRNIIQYCLRPWMTDAELAELAQISSIPTLDASGFPLLDDNGAPVIRPKFRVSDDTLTRHNDGLIERINATLGADDILIHAGDVAWSDATKLQEFRDRVNVKEVYVAIGNHDKESDLVRLYGRERVAERFQFTIGKQIVIVDHYPGDRWHQSHYGSYLLFGHTHGAVNASRRTNPAYSLSIDIGVDSHDFRPWLWEELVALFAERKPAFERWAAKAYSAGKDAGGMAPIGSP